MKLYKPSEIRDLLRISESTIRRRIASGEIPVVRNRRVLRITQTVVDNLLNPSPHKVDHSGIGFCVYCGKYGAGVIHDGTAWRHDACEQDAQDGR